MFGLLFDEVDKDKNGSVTLQELKLRMQSAVSRHDIKHFVQVINHATIRHKPRQHLCGVNPGLHTLTAALFFLV